MIAPANLKDVAWTVASYLPAFDVLRMRQTYDLLLDRWSQAGYSPTHLALTIGGKHGRFGDFTRLRARKNTMDWRHVNGFALKHMRADRDFQNRGFFDWSVQAHVNCDVKLGHGWKATWSIFPSDLQLDDSQAIKDLLDFARMTVDRYGHLFAMRREGGPTAYVHGLGSYGSGRVDDERNQVGAWWSRKQHFNSFMLRDIYPFNFITSPYLDLPVAGMTLERWIKADESRGTLEPLTDKVTTWRPVVENIPQIREALFRAGIMFYWRFFDQSDPMFRDFSKPWKPPDTIPEMFRAEFYKDQDPQITR